MSQAAHSASAGWTNQFGSSGRAPPPLSTVVYRSRAVADMTPPALRDLTHVSQARNSREAITGLMLFDHGRFYQWLEGPVDSVDRVMTSICHDARHTDIEVLNHQPANARVFGDWSMKLATHGAAAQALRDEVIEPPPEIVETLRARPEAAPVLLTRLVVAPTPDGVADVAGIDTIKLPTHAASLLKNVILSMVVPALKAAAASHATPFVDRRAIDLAELLIGADPNAAGALVQELQAAAGSPAKLYATLLEPAARRLGDLWYEDDCSEVDLTLGLCRLQTALRLLTAGADRAPLRRLPQPIVLIAPEPGELHRIGAALDGNILGNAGWAPHSEYPADDTTLQELVSSQWFDVLDLSMSVALRRDHWLPRVTETIAAARRVSQNPALVVVVGGRVFRECRDAGTNVGADATSTTSGTVDRSILRAISDTKTVTPTPS
jgi:methanogenic corrinoid protein MtbC1